jgi:protein gp37
MVRRLAANLATPQYAGGYVDAGGRWTGRMGLHLSALDGLARGRAGQRVFVGSMADLFHPNRPWPDICAVLDRLHAIGRHTYCFLTKHPSTMAGAFAMWQQWGGHAALPSTWWVGASVEDQAAADARIPALLGISGVVRFVSCEPLLGAIRTGSYLGSCASFYRGYHAHAVFPDDHHDGDPRVRHHHHDDRCLRGIDWIIAGGETGPGARAVHPAWVRGLRDQCVAAGVPFWFKGWGAWIPGQRDRNGYYGYQCGAWGNTCGRPVHAWDDDSAVISVRFDQREVLKEKRSLLDGRVWQEAPV